MGDTATELIMAAPVIFVFVFISTMVAGTVADTVAFRTYAGLKNQVELNAEVSAALSKLNRRHHHHSHYNYALGAAGLTGILAPVVFGLATATGIGALTSLFPTATVGRK